MPELSPSSEPSQGLVVSQTDTGVRFNFANNAPFLTKDGRSAATAALSAWAQGFTTAGVVLETRVPDYAVSDAEAQRIAAERLLTFRSLLIDAGVSPSLIKLKTLEPSDDPEGKSADLSYGWVEARRS